MPLAEPLGLELKKKTLIKIKTHIHWSIDASSNISKIQKEIERLNYLNFYLVYLY